MSHAGPHDGGDFLCRFDEVDMKNLMALRQTVDEIQGDVWKLRKHETWQGRKMLLATVDLDEVLPRLEPYFVKILVRGDSDFDRADIRRVCRKYGLYVALVDREQSTARTKMAMALDEEHWRPYLSRIERRRAGSSEQAGYQTRKKRANRRRRRARQRNYKELC